LSSISKIKLPNNTTYDINAATVNGHTVATDVPSGAVFTDTKVTQFPATDNANYEVLFSGSADNTAHTEGAKKSAFLKYNPSSHKLYLEEESTSGGLMTITTTSMGTSYLKAEESIFSEVSAGEYALSSNSYIEVAGSDIFHSNTWDGSHYYLKDAIYNVKQSPNDSTDAEYRILFSNTADDTERTEKVQKNSNITYNPLKSTLKIGRAFSSGGVTGTRDTSINTHGIKISEYVGSSLYGQLELQYRDIFLNATWDGTNTSLKDTITYLGSQSAANKVDKAGDTMTGTLLRTTADGAAWHTARDHALIRSHGFTNNGSWFPALSFLTTGGSWAIGSLSNSNNFWFSYTRNNEYTNNINKTDNYQLVPVNDGNAHTYTIAHSGNVGTGDSNGQVKIAGTNVSVKGLGSAAYYNAASANTANTVVYRDANRYIYAQYYNAGCGAETPSSSSYIVYSNSDGWFRKSTIANMKTAMSLSNYTNGTISGATSTTSHLAIGGILRAGYHSRTDTGDSGYMNFVNYNNNAYAPIRASGFTTMSSKHVKTNIQDISDEDAKKLLDIRPINFDYMEEVGGLKNQIGVLAEDTYKILPKVVSVPDDYVEKDFDISKGIHQSLPSVDYVKFTPYLIKMVQIQQREINSLKKIIEGRNDL